MRPLFEPPRTLSAHGLSARRVCQFDLWEPAEPRSRSGTARRAARGSSIACLGYSRAGAGALIFSKQAPDLLAGHAALSVVGSGRCRRRWSGTARAALHAGDGRPTEAFAAFCGQLQVDWRFCEPADPQAKGVVERLQGYHRDELRAGPACSPTSSTSRLSSIAGSTSAPTRGLHSTLRCRPIDRLARRARGDARRCPAAAPDTDRRWVLRVPPDPHLRVDTNDYSLDPRLVGRRVEVRVSQREVTRSRSTPASWPAATSAASPEHRTITALEHARALQAAARRAAEPVEVETRPLAAYDALIA